MPDKEISSKIIGSLDYVLRKSNYFSGIIGNSLNDLEADFIEDDGTRYNLRISINVKKH